MSGRQPYGSIPGRCAARGAGGATSRMSASDGLPSVSEHAAPFGPEITAVMRDREREADEFYADLASAGTNARREPNHARCSCTPFDAQLEDGVAASSGPPSSSPQWPRRSTIRSTHPIGIGANHWAIRNSITAAVSCSVIPDPATLDRMPM